MEANKDVSICVFIISSQTFLYLKNCSCPTIFNEIRNNTNVNMSFIISLRLAQKYANLSIAIHTPEIDFKN